MQFDYVIAGAGTAGCLLANRLSADPQIKVLLLEAGARDDWIWIDIPVGYLYCIGNPRTDWCYRTEPDPGLNGRSISMRAAKCSVAARRLTRCSICEAKRVTTKNGRAPPGILSGTGAPCCPGSARAKIIFTALMRRTVLAGSGVSSHKDFPGKF